jgi:hypothetical protein
MRSDLTITIDDITAIHALVVGFLLRRVAGVKQRICAGRGVRFSEWAIITASILLELSVACLGYCKEAANLE